MVKLNLQNPETDYRPIPFWSWNDLLDPEELRRQIREMHKQGIGGFFMHARGGLQTAYLSQEWMDCVNACCDEAGKLGMNAWLYDENGWPSGFGGGLVNGLGEDYQQKYLRFESVDADVARSRTHTIAFYSEDCMTFLGKVLPEQTSGKVIRAYYEVNPFYVDNLDAKVVKEFIRVTHQHYYDIIPKDLLAHMKGIFTDEPQLSRNGLVWSLVLEEAYKNEYDRDLLAELPGLGYDIPGAAGTRVRFWRLCAKLFRDHFAKQIREWCDAHGWSLTGHYVLEEGCEDQLTCNGAIMPQYQYLTIPGMDHLRRSVPSAITMTQLVSVAAQVGQKQILTESFALTGWNCNFSGQRYVYQPQLAHGVNLLCQHLAGYSLRGLRKRDYPASSFIHQPWWDDYHVINNHFSRIGEILAESHLQVETLVLHPQSSAWMIYKGLESEKAVHEYTRHLEELTEILDANQIAHHYADELLCETLGSCEGGKLHIGNCSYRTVVIPPVLNLSSKLYEMLRVFQLAGGAIFRLENPELANRAFCLDGEPADGDTLSWFLSLPTYDEPADVASKLQELLPNRILLTENGKPSKDMLSVSRTIDDVDGLSGTVHYVVNRRYHEGAMVHVSLPATGSQVAVLNEQTGQWNRLPQVATSAGRWEFDYYFGGADGALFFLPEQERTFEVADATRQLALAPATVTLPTTMTLSGSTENLLTLDRCRYRIDGGEWQTADIVSLQSRLVVLKHDIKVDLEIPFQVSADFDCQTPLTLVVERPDLVTFALNGVAFDNTDTGYLFDKAFRKLPLPKAVKPGENIISMSLNYHQPQDLYDSIEAAKKFETEYNKLTFETELESVYLAGAFSVRHQGQVETLEREAVRFNGSFELCPSSLGKTIDASDLLTAGYPFFAGKSQLELNFTLTAEEVKKIRALRFTPRGANSWKVLVNGKLAKTCFWEPYIVSVAGLLQEGENEITFILTTSLRNMLGPHHLAEGECYGVLTISFNIEDNFAGYKAPETVSGTCLVDTGILAVELV